MKAGQTLDYNVVASFSKIPVFQGSYYSGSYTLFDEYNSVIEFTLPNGLELSSVTGFSDVSAIQTKPAVGGTTYLLPVHMTSSGSKTFEISVYVDGNGTEDAISTYAGPSVHMETSFQILDKRNPNEYLDFGDPITQDEYDTSAGFTTVTEDEWGIVKSVKTLPQGAKNPTWDPAAKTATVIYTIGVGLKNGSNGLITDASQYTNRFGTDPVTSMSLTDVLSQICSNGETPAILSAKIQKGSGTEYNLSDLTDGIVLFGSTPTEGLTLNRSAFTVQTDLHGGKTDVPVYTEYTVTVVYQITDTMINQYYEDPESLSLNNTATLSDYTLQNVEGTKPGMSDDAPCSVVLGNLDPAEIQISKKLTLYTGADGGDYNDKYGQISYTLSRTDNVAFTVYERSGEAPNYTYTPIKDENNQTTYTSLKVTEGQKYYVTAGNNVAYQVTENLSDEQDAKMEPESAPSPYTAVPGDAWTAQFRNKETFGVLKIKKVDANGNALDGAVFDVTGITDPTISYEGKKSAASGYVNFGTDATPAYEVILPYGQYRIQEKVAPVGYSGNYNETITISASDPTQDIEVTNASTAGQIVFQKYVGTVSDTPAIGYNSNGEPMTGTYTATFRLQRCTTNQDADFVDVTADLYGTPLSTEMKLASSGRITVNVPAKDGEGNPYYYRFVENADSIPAGYYAPFGYNSDSAKIINDQGQITGATVSLSNRQYITVKVTKNSYGVANNGRTTTRMDNVVVQVELYSTTETGKPTSLTKVTDHGDNPQDTGRTTTDLTAQWSGLPAFDSSGARIRYFVKEVNLPDGWKLDEEKTGNTVEVGGTTYIEVPSTSNGNLNWSKQLFNVRQVVPVQIIKLDANSNKRIAGAKVQYKAEGSESWETVEIPQSDFRVWLEPGKQYTFEELTDAAHMLPNYSFVSVRTQITYPGKNSDTTSTTNSTTIDLSDWVYTANSSDNKNVVITFSNRMDPDIRIKKVDSTSATTTFPNVEYTIYEKVGDNYVQLTDNEGNPIKIKADGATHDLHLPAGTTYYFHEENVPAGYLDPDVETFYTFYSALNPDGYVRATIDGQVKTLAVGQVTNSTGTTNICEFTFKNIPNKGSIEVKKLVDGVQQGSSGFSITATGDDTAASTKTGSTKNNGTVVLSDLPVYNADGTKIKYTITETLSPSQELLYYKESDGQVTTLNLGSTVTTVNGVTGTEAEDLVVKNGTKITLNADKYFYHTWEFPFTNLTFKMNGVTLWLYEKQEDGSWKKVAEATTVNGSVSFPDLHHGKDFAIVEAASNDPHFHPTAGLAGTGWKLENPPETIANDTALAQYNYVMMTSAQIEAAITANNSHNLDAGDLYNRDHWIQFDFLKYLDKNKNGKFDSGEEMSNATFALYKLEVQPGTTSVTFGNGSGWTLVDTYSSGTLLDGNNNPIPGRFVTDVMQGVEANTVYVLVETSVGPNSAIMVPEYTKTFYCVNGCGITCTDITNGKTDCKLDEINKYHEIRNDPPSGNGEGDILIASLRLAKWEGTYVEEDGQVVEQFSPLPNAHFKVYWGTQVIAELTSGLDIETTVTYAGAMSGAFALVESETNPGQYWIQAYEGADNSTEPKQYGPVERVELGTTAGGSTIYGVAVTVVEDHAPDGYQFHQDPYQTYLVFYDSTPNPGQYSSTWVSNDLYFVTTATGDYTNAAYQSTPEWYAYDMNTHTVVGQSSNQLRIVNYKMENPLVRVRKYGYAPNSDTLTLTSEGLDALGSALNRKPLPGVQMKLQHKTASGWEDWNYTTNTPGTAAQATFTIENADGSYRFEHGLKGTVNEPQTYRIIETSLGDWETQYEIAYPEARARIFTVKGIGREITMYNPEKVDVSILKTDMAGNPLPGAKFKFGTTTITTGSDGIAKFENLASGNYKLEESTAPSGYSLWFLSMYLNEYYGLNANSIPVGYTYENSGSDTERDVKITKINPEPASGKTGEIPVQYDTTQQVLTLEIKVGDPKLGDFSVQKTDMSQPAKGIAGATFAVYRHEYTQGVLTTGETEVQPFNPASPTANGWAAYDTAHTNWAFGNSDTQSLTGGRPAIYAIYEKTAPAGYEILKNSSGQPIVYYVIVTGGIHGDVITIKNNTLPETESYSYNGTTQSVQTLYYSKPTDAATVTVAVPNPPLVPLKGQKIINPPSPNFGFEVNLKVYSEPTGGTPIATLNLKNTNAAVFKNSSNKTDLFVLGQTYYIEEEIVSPTTGFELTGVQMSHDDGSTFEDATQPSGSTRYAITISGNPDDVNLVAVTNLNLWGYVIFEKMEKYSTDYYLPGAVFEVQHFNAETQKWERIEGQRFTERAVPVGTYRIDFPLDSPNPTTYRVIETQEPEGYILPDPEVTYLEYTLSLEHSHHPEEGETEKIIYNDKGRTVKIVKYDNIHGATPDIHKVGEGKATFQIVQKNSSGDWVMTEYVKATDGNGEMSILLEPNVVYGFYEVSFDTGSFIKMESAYIGDTALTHAVEPVWNTSHDSSVEHDVYLIGTISEGMVVNAYNVPYIGAKIIKRDAGGYPENVMPSASFSIYEVPAGSNPTSEDEVTALIAGQTAVYSNSTTQDETNTGYTANLWNKRDPQKTYLVVETLASKLATPAVDGAYDTLNKNDNRVVWYVIIGPTDNPDRSKNEEFVLKNVFGDAKVDVDKTVTEVNSEEIVNQDATPKIPSLFKQSSEIVYTIKQSVTSENADQPAVNQPLSSYVLTDSGLTFTQDFGSTDPDAYNGPQPSYHFTSIKIGASSHVVENLYPVVAADAVQATVKFYDASNTHLVGEDQDVTLSSDATVTGIPATARSFTIEYFSENVKNGTSERYVLGEQFQPGDVTVKVTVDKLTGDSYATPAAEITAFTNNSSAVLEYAKWKNDGSGVEKVTKNDSDGADVTVKPIQLATVGLNKSVNPETIDLSNANTEGIVEVTYTLQVNNTGSAVLEQPVVLDVLPTGVSYIDGSAEFTGITGNMNVSNYTGIATETITVEGQQEVLGSPETAVQFSFTGDLQPGSMIEITFKVGVPKSVLMYGEIIQFEQAYGTKLLNDAFAGSGATSYHTCTNPHGYSIKDSSGNDFPVLEDAAQGTGVSDKADQRVNTGLVDALPSSYFGDDTPYTWTSSSAQALVLADSSLVLTKAIWGDQDPGYNEEDRFLGNASRTVDPDNPGWVLYRLTVSGGNSQRTGLIVGDVMSKVGDGRESRWDVTFEKITFVEINGSATSDYTVYYYTGAIGDATAAVKAALKTGDLSEWVTSVSDKADINAIIIKLGDDVVLKKGNLLVIAYETHTPECTDEEFKQIGFTNTNNTFYCNYDGAPSSFYFESNTVKATLKGALVDVAGDVWIDANDDGIQNESELYDEYNIVKQIRDGFTVTANDIANTRTLNADDPAITWDQVGNSLKHFSFSGLGAAKPKSDSVAPYTNNELDPAKLMTDNPSRYSLSAQISKGNISELYSIVRLTTLGTGHYLSDDPDALGTTANALDSNFMESASASSGEETSGQYYTLPFYLRYSELTDQSKDIGFVLVRNLELYKLDAVTEEHTPIEGATFNVYGPFEKDEAKNATLSDTNLVGTKTTDADGKITFEDLYFLQEYVIVETAPATGYSLDNLSASATTEGTIVEETTVTIDGTEYKAWILKLPATTKETKLDKVEVLNTPLYEGTWTPEAKKELIGRTLKGGEFTFKLEQKDGEKWTEIQQKSNEADGTVTFDEITYTQADVFNETCNGTATLTYRITEVIPDEADRDPNMEYSDAEYVITVTLTADPAAATHPQTHKKPLKVEVDPSDPLTIKFTNTYTPPATSIIPPVEKKITGEPPKVGATFTFKMEYVESADGPLANVKLIDKDATTEPPYKAFETLETTVTVADGDTSATGAFEEIYFTAAGTYTFKVTETATSDDVHYQTLDSAEWTYTVVVTYNNVTGELSAEGTYTKDGVTTPVASAIFENPYTPIPVEDAPKATKELTGEPTVEAKTFTFEITADSGNPEDGATLPATTTIEVTVPAGATTVDPVAFGNIKFEKAGTYKFAIKEVIPSGYDPNAEDNVWTYDQQEWTWTVVIKDADEKLVVESATYDPDEPHATFKNNYKPTPVEDAPKATKKLTGEPTVEAKTFTFEIAADPNNKEGGASFTGATTIDVTVPAGATTVDPVAFDNIKFEKAGTYKFTIKELKPNGVNEEVWTLDQHEWTWTVVIKDADEKLVVESATYDPDEPHATFINNYIPLPTEYTPLVEKLTEGPTYVQDVTFDFTLEFVSATNDQGQDVSDGVSPTTGSVSITVKAGDSTGGDPTPFDTLKFTRAGVYVFEIKETIVVGSKTIVYDETVWTLTVTVTDKDEYLEASAEYTAPGKDTSKEKATFTNKFLTGDLIVKKSVKGEEADKDKMFTFTVYLYDAEGNPLQGNYEIYIRYKNKETYAGDVENGTAVFKLKHDMTAVIVGIPIDATWKVVEEKYIHYYPGKTNDTGTIQADGNESVWINKWTDNPPGTGDNTNLILWGSLLGVSGIGIALLVVFAKKRKKEENVSAKS